MPVTYSGVQYSGIWNLSSQSQAKSAGTWPNGDTYGPLFAWGRNYYGQLGLGNTTYYSSPKQVGTLVNWISTSNTFNSNFAIKSDGTLWSWGYNGSGELGLGNTSSYSSPKQVGALTNWLQVASGRYHCIAVKTDGSLWTWGANTKGQLGLNTSGVGTYKSSPTQVGSLTTWLKVASGLYSSYGIKTDGTIWSWGWNSYGQLGIGNAGVDYSSPMQIGGLTTWAYVNGNKGESAFAIKTDGTLWSWGWNGYGQLGLGNTTSYASPRQIGALTTWAYVGPGRVHVGAVKTDGTLWTWGNNQFGKLGLGNTTYYSSPKQVGSLTNWLRVSFGTYHSTAIKTNKTIWSWGKNNVGQLGLGNLIYKSSPNQIGTLSNWLDVAGGNYSSTGIKQNS
jgi:alpha-tubulin suppressor-like RCC1 family protein